MLASSVRLSNATKLGQQLRRVAATWPEDPFRPNMQLKTFLESLADHPNLTPQAVEAAQALKNNEIMKKVQPSRLCAVPYHVIDALSSILSLKKYASPRRCRITTTDSWKALRRAPKAFAVHGGRFSSEFGRQLELLHMTTPHSTPRTHADRL